MWQEDGHRVQTFCSVNVKSFNVAWVYELFNLLKCLLFVYQTCCVQTLKHGISKVALCSNLPEMQEGSKGLSCSTWHSASIWLAVVLLLFSFCDICQTQCEQSFKLYKMVTTMSCRHLSAHQTYIRLLYLSMNLFDLRRQIKERALALKRSLKMTDFYSNLFKTWWQ